MSWVAVGVGGGTALAGIGSALIGSGGAKKQVDAMRAAIEESKRQYDATVSRLQPYTEFGKAQLNDLSTWLNDPNKQPMSYKDPGYEFRKEQGLEGLYSNAGVAGNLLSGDTIRAAETYGQDMASQEYNNAFNRWLQEGNFRQGLAGMGQSAAANLGYLGNQSAANIGNITANTDFAAPSQAWADVLGATAGAGMNALARRYLVKQPNQQQKTPGGSNIFYSEDE